MKFFLLPLLSVIFLNPLFCADQNQTMSDEEFMRQFMVLDQEIKKDQAEIDNERAKTAEMRKKTSALKKLEKTVDELGKQLDIEKK